MSKGNINVELVVAIAKSIKNLYSSNYSSTTCFKTHQILKTDCTSTQCDLESCFMTLLVLMRLCLKALTRQRSRRISNSLNFWLLYSMSWQRWRNVHRACLLIGNNFPKETPEGHSFSSGLSALLSNGNLSYFRDHFLPFNMNPRLQLLEWSREGGL